ncbi:type I polyketide synthase [Corynebacterium uterequi]|uniref:3-oxoacyl-(Acyl-carrier protein) reductase n=1 Tax=Corynebacterium uterequi TaxID=1072256 RepID=A0A0G3HF80_9CORY|nr:type I polyketide synthase [Corynebacterium uterequi]AKK11395.1 3-oxoacyl-(acyl-carrier protein) reductase [Corynebacterium uterequi]
MLAQTPLSLIPFHERLSTHPYSLHFAGQATPWQAALAEVTADPRLRRALDAALTRSDALLADVLPELTRITGGPLNLLDAPTNHAYSSVPGILTAQYGHLLDLFGDALPAQPVAAVGHSQGVLAVALAERHGDPDHAAALVALARLIGAAATAATRAHRAERFGELTPMLAVRGIDRDRLDAVLTRHDSVCVAIRNTPTAVTLSGLPAALDAVREDLAALTAEHAEALAAKRTGGAPLTIVTEFLDVAAPFHSPLLDDAVVSVVEWASRCPGLADIESERLARAVLTDRPHWDDEVTAALDAEFLLDLGPGSGVRGLTAQLAEGRGVGLIDASTADARDALRSPAFTWPTGQDYAEFAPRLRTINGRTVVDTAFTRLTGRAPVVLAGMTPTTTEPDIVAAAANAGYWAELAGGGQVTEEVIRTNLDSLKDQLDPGRTAQFNAMFMDRYLWNLQFGAQRVVTRERESGAPLDGVVISAGIPELDEGVELLTSLRASGFSYVSFKPGTVAQIRQTLAIARQVPEVPVIMMVEDGHAGGHHSWEDLDHLLLSTYAEIRAQRNVVLVAGGGLGMPQRAAEFLTGDWALAHGAVRMPVDAIMIGTAAMTAKEAHTNPDVKQLLVDIPGISAEDNGGWVGAGRSAGGVTSGLSHHLADMYEVDNAAADAARLIAEAHANPQLRTTRRAEIIAAINKTAKPYFGDLAEMTYAEVLRRYVELTFPFTDISWQQRLLDLCQRFEARLCKQDYGPIEPIFADLDDVADASTVIPRFVDAYPLAIDITLTPFDVAWFIELCRRYPKPVPFVPAIDESLLAWWGTDGLWQSHDRRYRADEVRIIPGPVSVAAITTVDEPVAEILGRYEDAMIEAIGTDADAPEVFSRTAETVEDYLRQCPHISWHGHLMDNPAAVLPEATLTPTDAGMDIVVALDTAWDATGSDQHAVKELRIPLLLGDGVRTGAVPVVDDARLSDTMFGLLAATAGVGSTTVTGTPITSLPSMTDSADSPFGEAHADVALSADLGALHAGVTAATLPADLPLAGIVPSAVLGLCWPTIYAALGSALVDDYPVIEGLLNAVHLDHTEAFDVAELGSADAIHTRSWCAAITESSSGRVVVVPTEVSIDGRVIGRFTERFAIRGRVHGSELPADPPVAGGVLKETADTPHSLLRRVSVTAPADMTAFAMVSGDYNPIHTSHRAARVAGMAAPLVHGMWLCAAAQHAVACDYRIIGWTYRMFGMVNLGDQVDISVERVGIGAGGHLLLDVTCRVGREIVSQATAAVAPKTTAYVYPGQGIQERGMALADRANSPAAREVWRRADEHTRSHLGFSILAVVRDNPTEITAGGRVFRHPEGVLHLTQFTQVALATVAFAQTSTLREAGVLVDGAYLAGHSLGEYNALASYAQIFPLETVLDIVYHRGSTMHHLVERDAEGRSNYRMAALRPNQFGVTDAKVRDYVADVAERCGEFLEIVNYNVAGSQYAVAGTVAGIDALTADATRRAEAAGGRRAVIPIPGIDVPFHSSRLRAGVPEFRDTLDALLPADINPDVLLGRYLPNLVARPFELSEDFLDAILAVAPSEYVTQLKARWSEVDLIAERAQLCRGLLIELLAWQFASPVRWIETQQWLFGRAGISTVIEVGLGNSPTLANIAARTLAMPEFRAANCTPLNVERDRDEVFHRSVRAAEEPEPEPQAAPDTAPALEAAASQPVSPAPAAPATTTAVVATIADVDFTAADAVRVLLAASTKLSLAQIAEADTIESLTNGVSSKRNQVLMDMSSELSLSAIDGASEATITELSATVNAAAHNYRPFGPVLGEHVHEAIRAAFGAAGVKASAIERRVRDAWALGDGWVTWTTAMILLGTRDGASLRGGDLGFLPSATNASDVDSLIDAAVEAAGAHLGVAVAKPAAATSTGGVVDSAALTEFREQLTDALAANARDLLERLGISSPAVEAPAAEDLYPVITAELGTGWVELVSPAFDARKAVELNDRWATAREDLAHIAAGEDVTACFIATGAEVARQARYRAECAEDPAIRARLLAAADDAEDTTAGEFSGQVAVVTGMTPVSIAGAVVRRLLAGGATVIATASSISQQRLLDARRLYRESARGDASLWLVPANLSSYRDIDALVEWVATEQVESVGGAPKVIKPALLPDLLFPFAAPPVAGTLDQAGPAAENQARLMLWGVERLLTALAAIGSDTHVDHRLHVVLPGSPNRGLFGGDGAYGEVKAAFDAVVNKWSAEDWGRRTTLAHARIGWVRGTGLMAHNDPLVAAVESRGVRTFSTAEMADELLALASVDTRHEALSGPVDADLTGGLAAVDFAALKAGVEANKDAEPADPPASPRLNALPTPESIHLPDNSGAFLSGSARPEDLVVIVGVGEIGPWGSARTRGAAEFGIAADGDVDLTAAGVLELAWMMGLLTWHETPQAGWYDSADQLVEEGDIYARFRDEVVARSGVREVCDLGAISDGGTVDAATVYLDRPISFTAADADEARAYQAADPQFTEIACVDGEWVVTRRQGATVRVPRRTTLTRHVVGQIPTGFDPARWGLPASLIENIDVMAQWNLVATVDAFLSAGFTPAELLAAVHPTQVGSTQGTGFGGMSSMRRLFVDRFNSEAIPHDVLQETLPNVIAAHTMQSYVGGYGPMVQPVAACASAAVSLEEGVDKIATGKASFVVTGAIDDLSVESLQGFGNMNATANSDELAAKGINPRFNSRAGDSRRGGFVEAQGGGTVLIARGDLALQLGLPVYAVVGYVQTFSDGIHSSIPAPGLGALAAGLGGRYSRLSRQLSALGISANDIAVVSKHDTSTNANDPNEAELHERLATAIGRSEGNPLHVISQKTLTGHAKGGAALFQIAGLTHVFASGWVPGNRSLDNQDPVFADRKYLVWPRQPLELGKAGPIKAALATSLGFGHVSSVIALAHPGAFEAAVQRARGPEALDTWRAWATERLRTGVHRFQQGIIGRGELYAPVEGRRLTGDAHDAEVTMLLDPNARLGADGTYSV